MLALKTDRYAFHAALMAALLALAFILSAAVARAGAVAVFDHSSVRLLGGRMEKGIRLAGVEILLKDGWKTYWRVPGDAGQPPVFDWKGSENVKSVTVLWPAPKRYADPEAGEAIGYKHRVIFPLRVVPADAGKPVVLRLKLDYALCNEICIPAHAQLERAIAPDAQGPDEELAAIDAFLARVPVRGDDKLTVVRASVRSAHKRPELLVTLKGKGLDENTEIFVEGPALASFCHPRFVSAQGDQATYFLPIDGIAGPQDMKGEELTLTIISAKRRVEQKVKLP